jgi:hypothetical protein
MTDTHSPDRAQVETPAVGHETTDADIGGVYLFGLGLMVTLVIVSLVVWMMLAVFTGMEARRAVRQYPLASGQQDRVPPAPRLQINPREDLRELRAREDAVLNSYGWVDKNAGVVRIPIGEAMKLTVERGLPVRGKP